MVPSGYFDIISSTFNINRIQNPEQGQWSIKSHIFRGLIIGAQSLSIDKTILEENPGAGFPTSGRDRIASFALKIAF